MNIMWHGTASLSIDDVLLIDPFIPNKRSKVKINKELYAHYNHVLLTHGHIDHVSSIPTIFKDKKVNIYGTEAVKQSLDHLLFHNYNFIEIQPGDCLNIDGYKIKVYKSKHTQFDKQIIKETFINKRMVKEFIPFLKMYAIHRKCQERNEIVGYLIEKDNKSVFILGSMNIDCHIKYPENIDMLVLPFQGTSYLDDMADKIVDVFKPKHLFLDHFDDTFPPISNTVDTTSVEIKYDAIKPDYQIPYEII